jgi:hypothetical protein
MLQVLFRSRPCGRTVWPPTARHGPETVVTTRVRFRNLNAEEIAWYVARGALDKAGATSKSAVERSWQHRRSYSNVVGSAPESSTPGASALSLEDDAVSARETRPGARAIAAATARVDDLPPRCSSWPSQDPAPEMIRRPNRPANASL